MHSDSYSLDVDALDWLLGAREPNPRRAQARLKGRKERNKELEEPQALAEDEDFDFEYDDGDFKGVGGVARASESARSRGRRLLRLPPIPPESRVAARPDGRRPEARAFSCACEPMSLEAQILQQTPLPPRGRVSGEGAATTTTRKVGRPTAADRDKSLESFLGANSALSRNRLARDLRLLRRRAWSAGVDPARDKVELALYTLERLVSESRADLASVLLGGEEDEDRADASTRTQVRVIRKPVDWSVRKSAEDVGRVTDVCSCSRGSSGDSGVELARQRPAARRFVHLTTGERRRQVVEALEFQSCRQVSRMVAQSFAMFARVVDHSALFSALARGDTDDDGERAGLLTCQELKFLACVECKKMRSAIRFDWITTCLALVFESPAATDADRRQIKSLASSSSSRMLGRDDAAGDGRALPYVVLPGASSEVVEREFLDRLAALMSQLLRRHLLVPLLSRWHHVFESYLRADRERMQIGLQVRIETANKIRDPSDQRSHPQTTNTLSCSQPDQEVKETLSFVVDELASVCLRLPRLESLLESSREPHEDSDSVQSSASKYLRVLQDADDLLATTKTQLNLLVDNLVVDVVETPQAAQSRATANELSGRPSNSWVDADYFEIIETINRLRAGDQVMNADQVAAGEDHRLRRLRLDCEQIRLLDRLEFRLRRELKRFHDLRFVSIDYQPLRESLLSCVQKERFLLVRLNLDEQVRLMETLRLQFDEIELNLDLESAIEDHLNEKWTMKQRHAVDVSMQSQADGSLIVSTDDSNSPESCDVDMIEDLMENNGENEVVERLEFADDSKILSGDAQKTETVEEPKSTNAVVDSFVDSITNRNPNVHQLLATSDTKGRLAAEHLGLTERQVEPLVESRLLVGRFEYLARLLEKELDPLVVDVRLVCEGFVFMSEFVVNEEQPIESNHWELISELSVRSKEFSRIVVSSAENLELSRQRLARSNELRSRVLSKLVVEFHQLMDEMSKKSISNLNDLVMKEHEHPNTTASSSSVGQQQVVNDNNRQVVVAASIKTTQLTSNVNTDFGMQSAAIRRLDLIQEASEWSLRLELRFEFLYRQNLLMESELSQLERAKSTLIQSISFPLLSQSPSLLSLLSSSSPMQQHEAHEMRKRTENRAIVLEKWKVFTMNISSFWRLAYDFESQQVKWVNSDTKRLEFKQLELKFDQFVRRLEDLSKGFGSETKAERDQNDNNDDDSGGKIMENLQRKNIEELRDRLAEFSRNRLPIFRFVTNKYLKEIHWERLVEMLSKSRRRYGKRGEREAGKQLLTASGIVSTSTLRSFTTLAQFLDVGVDEFIAELDEMSRQATSEHELIMLLMVEGLERQHDDVEAFATRGEQAGQVKDFNRQVGIESHPCAFARNWTSRVMSWVDDWSNEQLKVAASRYIELRLAKSRMSENSSVDLVELASKLVETHALVQRMIKLSCTLNLDFARPTGDAGASHSLGRTRLSSPQQVRPHLFIQFLKVFTEIWIKVRGKIDAKVRKLTSSIARIERHLSEIGELTEQVTKLRDRDLKVAKQMSERMLTKLERETVELELEREILATKEAQALEKQREALKIRDECVKQVTERAIPAIRAATRALDGLSEQSIRQIRSLRPNPPEPVRLVIEAVCLLRSCVLLRHHNNHQQRAIKSTKSGTRGLNQSYLVEVSTIGDDSSKKQMLSPLRRFDALAGRMVEDYWSPSSRMLNGTLSSNFINDLREVDKRSIPNEIMRLIRRKYLNHELFHLGLIRKVSRDCSILAKWLLAVDVFDRVINVVKPNYIKYLESERNFNGLLVQVQNKRREMDSICSELQQLDDSFRLKIKHKMSLTNSLEECEKQLDKITDTKNELNQHLEDEKLRLSRTMRKQYRLDNKCQLEASKIIYIDSARQDTVNSSLDASLLRALRYFLRS